MEIKMELYQTPIQQRIEYIVTNGLGYNDCETPIMRQMRENRGEVDDIALKLHLAGMDLQTAETKEERDLVFKAFLKLGES